LQPAKQQHTSKRIFERLRDEYGYGGGITIVKDYVHERRQRLRVQVSSPMRVQIVPAKAQSSSTPTLFSMSVDPRCWLNQPRLG
jgi:hypothetical protein